MQRQKLPKNCILLSKVLLSSTQECYCCRESFLRERLVTLTHCYDPDGGRLTGAEVATMDIRLREPAECRCFKCGDFSR